MSKTARGRLRKRRRGATTTHRDGYMLKVGPTVTQEDFAEPPVAIEQQFVICDSLEETAERMATMGMFTSMQNAPRQAKLEIAITPSFSMFIQNIVYTTGVIDAASSTSWVDLPEPADGLLQYTSDSDEEEEEEEEEDEARVCMSYVTRALRSRGCQYNGQRFESVILRSKRFESATLFFSTGKIVNTGCCRPEHAILQLQNDTDTLRKILPYETRVIPPHLENLVSSGAFPNTICTHYMTARFPNICSEVGGFPGTLIKDRGNIGERVIIVFDSGRICHSGGRSPTQIYEDLCKVMPVILACQSTPELVKVEAELRQKNADASSTTIGNTTASKRQRR